MQESGVRSFYVPWGLSATRSIAVRAACPPDHPAVMVHFDPSVALDALDATVGDALATVEHRVTTNNGRAQFLLLWSEAPTVVRDLAPFPHTVLRH